MYHEIRIFTGSDRLVKKYNMGLGLDSRYYGVDTRDVDVTAYSGIHSKGRPFPYVQPRHFRTARSFRVLFYYPHLQ